MKFLVSSNRFFVWVLLILDFIVGVLILVLLCYGSCSLLLFVFSIGEIRGSREFG